MALWQKIASRPELLTHMQNYYKDKNQIEIRALFAQWIEERIMLDKFPTGSTGAFEQSAIRFCEDLQGKLTTCTIDPMLRIQLSEVAQKINLVPPVDFYSHLRSGIHLELQLVEQYPPSMNTDMDTYDDLFKYNGRIQELYNKVNRCTQEVQQFHVKCEQFRIQYNDFRRESLISTQHAPQLTAQLNVLKVEVEEGWRQLDANRTSLSVVIRAIMADYDECQTFVIDIELKNWQRNQALAGNGAPFKDNLDDIQRCIELLLEIICKIRGLINRIGLISSQCSPNVVDNSELNDLNMRAKHAQERLILSAFIVEKQPPQVMKTHTRFAATVRWLIGNQLGIAMSNPTVECIILSEAQAQRHCAQRQMNDSTPHSSGEILNNIGNMEYQQQSRHLSASFRNMQLKKIKRAEKKGTESVMDEKFALLFYTTSVVNDYRIRAWTLSLPVVVIVHGNQEPQSWATITWDNAFSVINREPFQVPDRVVWSQLSCALNTKFCSATRRQLSEENMQFLYEKIFRGDIMGDQKDYVSWAQFCKEPLPDRTFTFWDWFFAIMKLTKDHLLGPWEAGRIIGFINKRKTTDEILKQCPEGTFLLRFSDSELGGITIAWVNECGQVYMLQPWTAKDLNVRGLADRIQDLQHLRYLYPNINKDEAFGEFYSPVTEEQRGTDGYVRNSIRAHIPGITPIYATTPQHSMQSPNPPRDLQPITTSDSIFQDNTIDFADMTWN